MIRRLAAFAALTLLAACATAPKDDLSVGLSKDIAAAKAQAQVAVPTVAVPLDRRPGWAASDAGPALAAFRKSCPALVKRSDASGLTQAGDWDSVCAAAKLATDARAFFATAFTPVQLGDGHGLNTGYYEPEIAGSRSAVAGYPVPFYRRPPDLIDVDLGKFSDTLKGKKIKGRVDGQVLIPYHDRAAIDAGALAGRGLELAWAADPYEAFFLEIQGSGRLRLADGSVMRIGYDGQNGRDYTAIGKVLRERGALTSPVTMESILGWLRAHPNEAADVLHTNKSTVFFRELTGAKADDGPIGALGVALTPQVSVAADPGALPLGAPLWLDSRVPAPFQRLMVAQDTGGAIKGPNRLDIFWGAGDAARTTAGALSFTGTMTLLLPPAAAARLLSHGAPPRP